MRVNNQLKGYKEALEWLDDNYCYFLTPILNMGSPEIDFDCSTAYVTLNPSAPDGFSFRVNPTFVESCEVPELAGVLAHETMHVLLSHLTRSSEFPDGRKFNIAADCIINDYLYDAGFELPEGTLRGMNVVGFDCALRDLHEVYYAIKDEPQPEDSDSDESEQSMPGTGGSSSGGGAGESGDSSNKDDSTSDGESKPSEKDSDDESSSESSSEGDSQTPADPEEGDAGEGSAKESGAPEPCGFHERAAEALAEAAANGTDIKDLAKRISDAIMGAAEDVLPDALKPVDASSKASLGGNGAGTGFDTVDNYAKASGLTVNWVKLLAEINPDILKKPGPERVKEIISYHAPRRKIAAYYPNIILPNSRPADKKRKTKGNLKPSIVLALDTSGSIPRDMVTKMTNLANSIPSDLIDVFCCTFSTQYAPYDITQAKNRIASGGTDFSAVEQFIRDRVVKELDPSNKNKYPTAVIVITDGEARFSGYKPSSQQLEGWTWMSIPGMRFSPYYIRQASPSAKIVSLKDYI